MKNYELIIESVNPCGGIAHSQKTFSEISTDSPLEYAKELTHFEHLSVISQTADETVIRTEDHGYIRTFYFSQI